MNVFETTMKEVDTAFSESFNRITFTGSFFEGLKISSPDEYDCNVIIKPKLLNLKPLVKHRNCPPGYIAIQVINGDKCDEKPFKDWLYHDKSSNRYFLKIDDIRYWLQGVLTKAKNKIEKEQLIKGCKLRTRQSGPACTLVLIFEDPEKEVSIDLVPCLEFKKDDWPGVLQKPKKLLNVEDSDTWFAVPKRPRNTPVDLSKNKLWEHAWRMSFPIQERRIMNGLNYLKYTLRLLKQVRDQLKIYAVASYYIKTIFLWEVEKQEDKTIWMKSRRGRLFVYMLTRFQEALEKGKIPFFWDEDCNLIEHVSPEFLKNSAGRLKNVINKIKCYIKNEDNSGLEIFIRYLSRKPTRKTRRARRS